MFGKKLTATAALLGLALAGCSDEGGVSVLTPTIQTDPEPGTNLAVEDIILGRSRGRDLFIQISNIGTGTLDVQDVTIEGDGADAFQILRSPSTVAAGDTRELYIRFEPDGQVRAETTLTVRTNDRERPEVTFPLAGFAREPCVLSADQSRMFFDVGDVRTVTFTTISQYACSIERISIDREVFPIIDEPETPLLVEPGQSIELQIEHLAVGSSARGTPIRELLVREADGGEVVVVLEGEPPLFDCLSFFPTLLSFSSTQLGESRTQSVTVLNKCNEAATLTSALVGFGWEDFSVSSGPYPTTVEANGSVDVTVTYAPTVHERVAEDQGRLIINTNDAALPRIRVGLTGQPGLPEIEYFPQVLEFGTVIFRNPGGSSNRSECSSAARFVQIHNTGGGPLTITGMELASTGDSDFLIASVSVDGTPVADFTQPFQVEPSQTAIVGLVFFPTRDTPALHESQLLISHNAGVDPIVISLSGDAAMDGPVQDVFTQPEGPKVDILWVIDDSCSMFDEQARLAENLSQFVSYADSLNADYQMGVITTDAFSTNSGLLEFCYPHPRIVKHDYIDREEAFDCLFRVGVGGTWLEAGMGAGMRAIQRAQSPDTDPVRNPNTGFVRDDASLSVVIMSDEDDQSVQPDSLLESFFKSVKGPGGADRTKVHAIAGPTNEPCITNQREAQPGYRYLNMTQRTGGQFFNICLDDWQPLLQNLGIDVFQPFDQWTLSQAATPGSVTVTVDGVPVPANGVNGFSYDNRDNTVTFHGAAVPTPGAQVAVDYLGNCTP